MPAKDMRLEIKLDEIFGARVPDDPAFRGDVAQEAIDIIVERTQKGKGLDGKDFAPIDPKSPYGKYKKGITGSTKADLTLFGDMLGSIEPIEESRGKIVLGFSDELQNAKAYNHNTGDTITQREFWGLTDKEKMKIYSKFAPDLISPEELSPKQLVKENRLLEALRYLNDEHDQLTFDNLMKQALKKSLRGFNGE